MRSVLAVALVAACQATSSAPAFTLSCHSASTATTRQMHCIRTDTRSGEVLRVEVAKLPTTNGPTASAAGPAGRYQTACATAASTEQADFYCIRLNTESGELMAINLSRVSLTP